MKELVTIQQGLIAPKDKRNDFGKYNYRSAESILEAVKPLLKAAGCTLTISDDMVAVGERIYVKASVTLTNAEGESITTTAFAREEDEEKGMDAAQLTGACSSYARKYALGGLFCIDDNKDADALNVTPEFTQKPADKRKADAAVKKATRVTLQDVIDGKAAEAINFLVGQYNAAEARIPEASITKARLARNWDDDAFIKVVDEANRKAFTMDLNA